MKELIKELKFWEMSHKLKSTDREDLRNIIDKMEKQLTIPVVVGTLPKCEHKNIDRQDGCDECLDCGVRNY